MGKKRKYEMMDEEALVQKNYKLQKVLHIKQSKEKEERSPSTFRLDNNIYEYNIGSFYLTPSEWAGTVSPSRESPDKVAESAPPVPSLSPQAGPSSACADATPMPDKKLDESILSLLGDEPKPETVFGSNIHKDVAARWQEILTKGLSKETKEKLISEYLIPANCDLMIPPVLNPEAKAALPDTHVKRDFSLLNKQKQLTAALAALAQVTTMLISNDFSREKLLKPICDASRLLCDSHQLETKTRRNFVLSSINHNLRGALIDSRRDKFLFGENLTEKLNAAKTIKKSGDIKTNYTKEKPKSRLNAKALHPRQTANSFDAAQNQVSSVQSASSAQDAATATPPTPIAAAAAAASATTAQKLPALPPLDQPERTTQLTSKPPAGCREIIRGMTSHAAGGVGRALCCCLYSPRKRYNTYLLLLLATFLAILVFSSVNTQLPLEDSMEQRIAVMQSRIQFLETLYLSRQEDVVNIQAKIMAKQDQRFPDSMATIDGATTMTMEVQALLRNINGTRAAAGALQRNFQALKLPFIYHLLPHLMNDPHSLRPAYHMKSNKFFSDVVIGVPTVKRDKESYLMITLSHLISEMSVQDYNSTLIVVMVGETDLEFVINTARQIETQFSKYVEMGLIEVISPSTAYYPNFDTLPVTLGDSLKRVKWRTKQNLDAIYLMAYAQPKGVYYLMLEDDVIAKKNYMQEIKDFAATTTLSVPNWFYIEFCQVGGIGKLFKSCNLLHFITYVQLFYNNMPIDWLLESYLSDRVCTIEKNSKNCVNSKLAIRPRYKTSLFQHIGLYSSLQGKIQKIKDSHFGAVPTFYPHQNPPLKDIRTSLKEQLHHTIKTAYDGHSFFWGLKPKAGDYIEFWFEKPTTLQKYMFRSGNVEHVSDKFYSTNVEVLPVNESNFTVVGSFDEFGLAEGELKKDLGPLTAIKLQVMAESQFWVILSEIELKPLDDNR